MGLAAEYRDGQRDLGSSHCDGASPCERKTETPLPVPHDSPAVLGPLQGRYTCVCGERAKSCKYRSSSLAAGGTRPREG